MPSSSDPLTRQEHLQTLPAFCVGLARALAEDGPEEKWRPALSRSLTAECVLCGITVGGTDLLALGAPAESAGEDPRLARLRQSYCARNGCPSYFYRLTFRADPALNWSPVLARVAAAPCLPTHAPGEADAARVAAWRGLGWQVGRRLLAGAAVLALLWLFRQWYTGGTIPLVREPEHFTADPASVQDRPFR